MALKGSLAVVKDEMTRLRGLAEAEGEVTKLRGLLAQAKGRVSHSKSRASKVAAKAVEAF